VPGESNYIELLIAPIRRTKKDTSDFRRTFVLARNAWQTRESRRRASLIGVAAVVAIVLCVVASDARGQSAPNGGLIDATASRDAVSRLAAACDDRAALANLPADILDVPLTKEDAARAAELLWVQCRQRLQLERRDEFDAKRLQRGELVMPFEYRVFGDAPPDGRSLFISMHGGGETRTEVNDQQWRNQIRLYQPKEGVYVAPRAPTDRWNLWHEAHIDDFFATLIEDFVLFENVDPNRVYLMGYSAGGDGVYQLAPRMADRLAAAAMMAGHPNEAEPLGLRNIGFAIHVGELDAAFNRNEVAREWGQRLDQLEADDPDGYAHVVKLHSGKGHWMDRQDAEALDWLAQFRRTPFPKRVVWRQDDVTHDRFYWLAVPPGSAKADSLVTGTVRGQQIEIASSDVGEFVVRLNDELVDMDQAITIEFNGSTVFQGHVPRTVATMVRSLNERADRASLFTGEVPIRAE